MKRLVAFLAVVGVLVAAAPATAHPSAGDARALASTAIQRKAGLRQWRINRVGPHRIHGEPGGFGDLAGAHFRTVFAFIYTTCGSPVKRCVLPTQADVTVVGPGGLLGVTRVQTYPKEQRPCRKGDGCSR